VYVRLASALPFDDGRRVEEVGTCSTDLRPFSHLAFRTEDLPQLEPIAWTEDDIFALTRDFEADSPMHRLSFGSHSCYLAQGAEVLYCCEDLGRHNAFDKVLGCALIDGVDLGKCTIFTSGRVPTDMVAKAIRAKVPILVSKAVPTDLTLHLAREHGLTLICSAHSDSFRVFNAPGKQDW
jgi:FdhD protein